MTDQVELVVNPWLPVIVRLERQHAWYLFADPNAGPPGPGGRVPAAATRPRSYPVKSPNAIRVGGGAVAPRRATSTTTPMRYRVRHVTGAAQLDPLHTYAGTGAA